MGHSFHAFSLECPETPISLRFLTTRGPKLGQYWPKSNHFGRWSGYTTMPYFKPFLPDVLLRMPRNTNSPTFFATIRPKLASFGQNRIVSGGGQVISACHISVHSFYAFSLECSETWPGGRWPTLRPHTTSSAEPNIHRLKHYRKKRNTTEQNNWKINADTKYILICTKYP